MAKLSKLSLKNHQRSLDLLQQEHLTEDERFFILENWQPSAGLVTRRQVYFTPVDTAAYIAQDILNDGSIIDMGSGIGRLTWYLDWQFHWSGRYRKGDVLYAVEQDKTMFEVGQKILPDVTWIHGDVFDRSMWASLDPRPHFFVSNPPFTRTGRDVAWLRHSQDLGLMFIEAGLRMTEYQMGVAIVPQTWSDYKISNVPRAVKQKPINMVSKFLDLLDIQQSSSPFPCETKFQDTPMQTEIVHWEAENQHLITPMPLL